MRTAFRIGTVVLLACATNICPTNVYSTWGQDEEVRFYEQGGITYREVKTKVRRPVRDVEWQDQQQTLYRHKYDTQLHTVQQYRYAPVTQYYWEPRIHGRWNIITGPHAAYHLRQQTIWQAQTRTAQLPVTQRTIEPETRTVRVAVPKLSMKEEEVVSRVAVGPAASKRSLATAPPNSPPPVIAWNLAPSQPAYGYGWSPAPVYVPANPQLAYNYGTPGWNYNGAGGMYGGVARLQSDPPRYRSGYDSGNAGAWQARRNTTDSR